MIQFNLLPDVKLEYIRTRRFKRFVVVSSFGVASTFLTIMILLLLVVKVIQKSQLSKLNKDIKTSTQKLQSIPDLDKILTIQNQLTTLPQLHAQKPVASRLFKYLVQVTPATVKMSQLDMDFSTKTLNITGESDSLSSINKFVDTLKFTTYSSSDSADPTKDPKAFSNIVVASFGLENGKASYTINLNFDDKIFDISQDIKLTVPKIITTVSETEKPAAIFQPKTQEKN